MSSLHFRPRTSLLSLATVDPIAPVPGVSFIEARRPRPSPKDLTRVSIRARAPLAWTALCSPPSTTILPSTTGSADSPHRTSPPVTPPLPSPVPCRPRTTTKHLTTKRNIQKSSIPRCGKPTHCGRISKISLQVRHHRRMGPACAAAVSASALPGCVPVRQTAADVVPAVVVPHASMRTGRWGPGRRSHSPFLGRGRHVAGGGIPEPISASSSMLDRLRLLGRPCPPRILSIMTATACWTSVGSTRSGTPPNPLSPECH